MATEVKKKLKKWIAVPPPSECTDLRGHKIATEFLPGQDFPSLVQCVYCQDTGHVEFTTENG